MAEYVKQATRKGRHGADVELTQRVRDLLARVERGGDAAVREMSREFGVVHVALRPRSIESRTSARISLSSAPPATS